MDTTSPITLSPIIFDAIQNSFIQNFSLAFSQINTYATQLFYILATLEICLFGLIWALKQQEMFGMFFFKILKLGVVFFIISNFATLLNMLVNGLAVIGFSHGNEQIAKLVLTPDLLWRYGFDSGISLLQLAVQYGTTNMGVSLLYLILGFGILMMFTLIGCQIILLIVGFYLISLMALLFLPFGTFTLTEKLFTRSMHGVLQAAVRIFVLIAILGIGVTILGVMNPGAFTQTTTLDHPLGLFVTVSIITILCWKAPSLIAASVGELGGELFAKTGNQSTTSASFAASPAITSLAPMAAVTNVNAATLVTGSGSSFSGSNTSTASAGAVNVSAASGHLSNLNQNISELTQAVKVQKEGISRETLNKLKATFKEAIKSEQKNKAMS